MKITFYGRLASIVGRDLELAIDQPCTIGHLRHRLAEAYPEAARWLHDRRARAAVAGELAPDGRILAATDEVEFLAPVSGG